MVPRWGNSDPILWVYGCALGQYSCKVFIYTTLWGKERGSVNNFLLYDDIGNHEEEEKHCGYR